MLQKPMAATEGTISAEKATQVTESLQDYDLGKVLGSGAFGTVRLGVELSSGKLVSYQMIEAIGFKLTNEPFLLKKQVAIKSVSLSAHQDISSIDRAWREVFILTSLDHEHIIRLFNVCHRLTWHSVHDLMPC
jgi:serine/threonine protein kinase